MYSQKNTCLIYVPIVTFIKTFSSLNQNVSRSFFYKNFESGKLSYMRATSRLGNILRLWSLRLEILAEFEYLLKFLRNPRPRLCWDNCIQWTRYCRSRKRTKSKKKKLIESYTKPKRKKVKIKNMGRSTNQGHKRLQNKRIYTLFWRKEEKLQKMTEIVFWNCQSLTNYELFLNHDKHIQNHTSPHLIRIFV